MRLVNGLTLLAPPMTIAGVDPSRISRETLLGKVLRVPFKLLPKGAIVRVVRGPARGKRWIADSSTHGFWLGYWELENQRLFAAHLRSGDVVYDVGAHVGLYTLVSSAQVGAQGHVYAFEPFPRNAQYLRRHIELNRLSNCTVVEAAVSNSSAWQRFDPTAHDTAGFLSTTGAVTVRSLTLDEFLSAAQERRPPNAIKINAEGAEMEILSGARRILNEFSPLIFLSAHSHELSCQCCELLCSVGYRIKYLSKGKIWADKST